MPSTFLGLNTAYLGLSAANASMNTTANNISNVETEGYSRQHTVQQASEAMRFFTSFGCVGAGVEVLSVERYRNEYYDARYWDNQGTLGNYEVKQYYNKQIEDYFIDDPDVHQEGFTTIFSKLYNSLQEVIKMSGSAETRIQYLGSSRDLTSYFKSMYENLQAVQKDANSEIKVQIDQINSMAQKIATLNKQINVIEIGGGKANALRDERATIIDELSKIVDVECSEQHVVDNNNFDRDTGATRFVLKIAGGQVLIDDTDFNTINCIARGLDEKVNQSDAEGLYDLYWSNGNVFSLNNAAMGGKLQGLLEIRDGNNGEYFHGKVGTVTSVTYDTDGDGHNELDERGEPILFKAITIEANELYMKDMNKSTLPEEGGKINVDGADLTYEAWEMEYDASRDTYTYTFILSAENDQRAMSNMNLKEAKIGSGINYQGIPYYMEQMNEWLRIYSKANNGVTTQRDSVNTYGDRGDILFTANNAPTSVDNLYGQWTFEDDYVMNEYGGYVYDDNGKRILLSDYRNAEGKKQSYKITSLSNTYHHMTAGNIDVSEEMLRDYNKLATHTGNVDEESKQDIVQELMDLRSNLNVMAFRGATAGEFLQCIQADMSLNAQNANNFTEIYEHVGNTINNQRMSVSGVDEDEEAVDLVKFQNAYNLASKMIQVLSEVYDRLILQTGV